MKDYYKPFLSTPMRFITGASLLSVILLYFVYVDAESVVLKEIVSICILAFVLWGFSTFLTDKYTHKYPQRYFSYSLVTTLKAFALVYSVILIFFLLGILSNASCAKLLYVMSLFLSADFFLSLLKSKQEKPDVKKQVDLFLKNVTGTSSVGVKEEIVPLRLNHSAFRSRFNQKLPEHVFELIRRNVTNDENTESMNIVLLSEDLPQLEKASQGLPAASSSMIVGQVDLNSVKRLNSFLRGIADTLQTGGYCIVHYKPLEFELEKIKQGSTSFTYPFKYLKHLLWFRALPKSRWLSKLYFSPPFAWIDTLRGRGQRRSMARAEAWGRLFFHGMQVLDEVTKGEHAYVIAEKVAPPSTKTMPTYHSIVALYKMGLNGNMIRLHKIRSMYPFSEFLQKHLYQMHGLTNTGKFKNDFRLTEYGPFIRKYWIDEIPGIYDWLRGDVKLVGMRATSPHYLSLYPREVIELYFLVKPGLVPPIFDEKTTGFEQIVEIERKYLESYLQNPIKTDLLYFWYTFRDIFIRKVRSK